MIFPDTLSVLNHIRDNPNDLSAKYLSHRSRAHADGWGTHVPLLASVLATSEPGPVLEIGVGNGSSPLLVEMCRAMGRDLIGMDSSKAWLDEIRDIGYPSLLHITDWELLPGWMSDFDKQWSVIFIDHGPGEARLPALKACRNYADHIVVHDTLNPGYMPGMDDYLSTFRYRTDYIKMTPCTSVVSDLFPYPRHAR
jgi:hypothetical protein